MMKTKIQNVPILECIAAATEIVADVDYELKRVKKPARKRQLEKTAGLWFSIKGYLEELKNLKDCENLNIKL